MHFLSFFFSIFYGLLAEFEEPFESSLSIKTDREGERERMTDQIIYNAVAKIDDRKKHKWLILNNGRWCDSLWNEVICHSEVINLCRDACLTEDSLPAGRISNFLNHSTTYEHEIRHPNIRMCVSLLFCLFFGTFFSHSTSNISSFIILTYYISYVIYISIE